MSIEAVAWALNVRVKDPMAKLVLIALANHANHDNWCYPSRKRISEYAECSLDTVDRRIGYLMKIGLVQKERRNSDRGDQTSNYYYLNVEPLTAATPAANSGHPAAELSGPNHKGKNGTPEGVPGERADKKVTSIKSKKPSSPEAKALAALFNRSEDRIWSDGEIRVYRKMKPTLDDIALITTYYAFERKKGGDGIHRKDLKTFLNNYPGELDRANAWKADPKANEKTRNASGAHQRGHSSRNAGTFNEGKGAEYKGLQRTT